MVFDGKKAAIKVLGAVILLLLLPSSGFCVQGHGGTEGLVAHEIGHVLFAMGMSYLLYRSVCFSLRGPGWPEFKTFLVLIILWNIVTFTGHWQKELMQPHKFRFEGEHIVSFDINTVTDAWFYLSRYDHLVLLPALFFLLFALRRWARTP